MHPEIDNLIYMALADGEVTEKERAIILRKAEALGEDKDETGTAVYASSVSVNKYSRTIAPPL